MASVKTKQNVIRMLDVGGHQEYYCCTSLFLADSGTFLVCVDIQKIQEKQVEGQFYASVGSYVDLVVQGTQGAGIKPKVVLVATKVEETANAKSLASKLLDMAKTQLKSLKADVFVVNVVWMTSSKNADREYLCQALKSVLGRRIELPRSSHYTVHLVETPFSPQKPLCSQRLFHFGQSSYKVQRHSK